MTVYPDLWHACVRWIAFARWTGLGALLIGSALLLPSMGPASADVCEGVRGMLRAAERSGGGSDSGVLQRQLSALRGLQRQRGCTAANSTGGFFNACADLSRRTTAVQQQIASLRDQGRTGALRAKLVSLGCDPARTKTARSSAPRNVIARGSILFCVRLADGYFFPAPNSQFGKGDEVDATIDRCRFICDTQDVDLYTLGDPSSETEQMVSVKTGKAYSDLPGAFRYRDSAQFQACDLNRYVRKVDELRSRTVTPHDMRNALVPVPPARPEAQPVAQMVSHLEPQASTVDRPAGDREVRVVGPAFLPD